MQLHGDSWMFNSCVVTTIAHVLKPAERSKSRTELKQTYTCHTAGDNVLKNTSCVSPIAHRGNSWLRAYLTKLSHGYLDRIDSWMIVGCTEVDHGASCDGLRGSGSDIRRARLSHVCLVRSTDGRWGPAEILGVSMASLLYNKLLHHAMRFRYRKLLMLFHRVV